MAKRLTDNINSQFFEAANRMTSKKARRKIVAYVESYDDVFFWRSVLGKFENEKRYFDIMLPTRNQHLDRGKKAAISSMLKGVGRDMIACVDAVHLGKFDDVVEMIPIAVDTCRVCL